MSRSTNLFLTFVVALAVSVLASSAYAVSYSWVGNASSLVDDNNNWNPNTGHPNSSTADTADFGAAGTAGTLLFQGSPFLVQNLNFNAGASAYTWNTSGLDVTMGSTSAAATQGTLTNNSGTTEILNMGAGVLRLNGTITGSDTTIINGAINPGNNINSATAGLFFTNSGNVYLNVDSSIIAGGNSSASAWLANTNSNNRANTRIRGSGTVYFGNIGTAYTGRIFLDGTSNGALRLTHNNALGGNGTTGASSVFITGGNTTGNTTLELVGGITVSRIAFVLDDRSGAVATDPHVLNVSGNNTIFTSADWNTNGTGSGNWNIQSDAGKLTLANGNVYNTTAATTTMQLTGAGDGAVTGSLVTWSTTPSLNVVKSGSGTWTFSSIPTTGQTTVKAVGADNVVATPTASAVSIFTGTMQATQGTLEFKPLATSNRINLTSSSTITVSDGAKLKISPFDTSSSALNGTAPLLLGSSTGSSIDFNLLGVPSAAPLAVGAFTTGGTNTINIASTAPLTIGSFPLISYTGGSILGAGFGSLAMGTLPLRTTASLVDTTTSVNLNVTAVDSIRWNGGVSNTWNINSTTNWKEITSGNTTTYLQPTAPGEAVTFDDNAAGNFAISASVAVNPVSMTFNNNSNDYSFSGAGITTTSLTTTGSRNVDVTGGNFAITGTATIGGAGTVTISNTGSTFSAANMAINSGTVAINRTDNLTGASAIAANLTGSGGTFLKKNTNTVEITGNNGAWTGSATVEAGTLATRSATALTNTVVQSGATLDMGSTTTGTAATTPPAGIAALKAVTIAGNGVGGLGALTVITPGPNANGNNAHVGNLTLTADATIRVRSPGSTATDFTNRAILWVEGAVTGNAKNLTAIVDVTNSYSTEFDLLNSGATGLANINLSGGGVFYVGGTTDLGDSSSGTITLGDTGAGTLGRLGIYGTTTSLGTPTTVAKPISVTAAGGGIELYRHGANNYDLTSSVVLAGDLDLAIDNATSNSTTTITLTGPITGTGNLTAHVQSTVTSRLGMVALTSDGNTYNGTTTIGGGGGLYGSLTGVAEASDRVSLSIGNGSGTGSIGAGDISINAATTTASSTLFLNRTAALPWTLANNITLNSTTDRAHIEQIGGDDATISGDISGSGRIIVNNSSGILTLSGDNSAWVGGATNTGLGIAQKGHLVAASNNAWGAPGTNSAGYVEALGSLAGSGDDTAALVLTNNITITKTAVLLVPHTTNDANVGPQIINVGNNELIATLATDADPTGGNNFITIQSNSSSNLKITGDIRQDHTGAATLTLRGAGTGEVTGSISQPATRFFDGVAVTGNTWDFVKEGSGTWKLSGNSTYTGTTAVNNGTLLVNGTHTGGGAYAVNSDLSTTFGTLGGTGTIDASVTVNPGGTLAPGASVGTLTVGSATLNTDTVNNSKLLLQYDNSLGQKIDKLVVTGALNIDGATLDFDNIGTGALNGSPLIIAAYGSLAGTTNVFASILDMPATYSIDYNYLSGNQIAILSSAAVSGDWNGDTKVNAADYVSWRKDPTNHGGNPGGYVTWRENFSQAAGSAPVLGSPSAVPEPATCGLVLCALLGLLSGRSRRIVRAAA